MPQLLTPASFPFLFVSSAGRRKKLSNNPQYHIQPWLSVAHTVIYFPEEGKGLRGVGERGRGGGSLGPPTAVSPC